MNLMIDFETLDITPSSVVLSVGLVAFTEKEIVDTRYIVPNHQQQISAGRTISMDTLIWWMKQSDDAKKVFNVPQMELLTAIENIHGFLSKYPGAKLWSNGANFDAVILDHLFAMSSITNPVKFWDVMCLRTFGNVTGKKYSASREKSPTHNALEDAVQQTQYLLKIWNPNQTQEKITDAALTPSSPASFKIGRRK